MRTPRRRRSRGGVDEILADVGANWPVHASMPLLAAPIGYVTKVLANRDDVPADRVRRPRAVPRLAGRGARRAARMASIACDTMTAKLISPAEVFARLDAERVAKEIERPLRRRRRGRGRRLPRRAAWVVPGGLGWGCGGWVPVASAAGCGLLRRRLVHLAGSRESAGRRRGLRSAPECTRRATSPPRADAPDGPAAASTTSRRSPGGSRRSTSRARGSRSRKRPQGRDREGAAAAAADRPAHHGGAATRPRRCGTPPGRAGRRCRRRAPRGCAPRPAAAPDDGQAEVLAGALRSLLDRPHEELGHGDAQRLGLFRRRLPRGRRRAVVGHGRAAVVERVDGLQSPSQLTEHGPLQLLPLGLDHGRPWQASGEVGARLRRPSGEQARLGDQRRGADAPTVRRRLLGRLRLPPIICYQR